MIYDMKRVFFMMAAAMALVACGTNKQNKPVEVKWIGEESTVEGVALTVAGDTIHYTQVVKPEVDLSTFPVDKEGYIVLFDGSSLAGWRGYLRDTVTARWSIAEDGSLHFTGKGGGEAQKSDGGDIIFAHRFQNFELKFDWKVSKGGNSGVFYMGREILRTKKDGSVVPEHIYLSAPEYQILDNENHPDAKLGVDGNRQSASLYDMIPAKPQNQHPAMEWNTGSIMVYQGTVVHGQNDVNVLEYHLWTPEWTEMLQGCKFSQEKWPLAFELLNNLGGEERAGYIGFQDHGDDVWYRNIRIKLYD